MNIKKFIAGALGTLLIGLSLATIPVTFAQAKDDYKFSAKMKAGYGNNVYVGYGIPYFVGIENQNNKNFEGYIQLIVPNFNDNNIMYEQELSLGAGEKKNIVFDANYVIPSDYVNVRVTNKKGKVVWEELQPIKYAKTMNEVRVGVLSDDFTALAYMDRQHFLSDSNLYTSLIELDKDTLSEDYQSLSSLNVIVISDYSTDLLTKEQISALNLWVQNGGLLLIGTGSTANKVMNGLNGSIINATVVDKGDRETTLGLLIEDYSFVNKITSNVDTMDYDRIMYLDAMFYQYYYVGDYDYYANTYSDDDGDGINDAIIGNYRGYYDSEGQFYDSYDYPVAKEYEYLFDYENSTYVDNLSNTIHYKYYDERYGRVNDSDTDIVDFIEYAAIQHDDYYDSICFEEYCRVYGFDPKFFIYDQFDCADQSEVDEKFNQIFGDDYIEFKRHFFNVYYYYAYYNQDMLPDYSVSEDNSKFQNEYNYIVVDTTEYNVYGVEEVLDGDTKGGDVFPLFQIIPRGNGKIVISAVDFTKNPIPKSTGSGDMFRNLIERLIGVDFAQTSQDYNNSLSSYYYSYSKGWSYHDPEHELMQAVASAPVPPLFVYAITILVYLIAVLVFYIIFRAKNKTFSLWKFYPIMIVILVLTIFSLGFSTRLLRLNVNIVSIIKPQMGVTIEKDYIAATIPKDKEYAVNFSKEVTLNKTIEDDGYFTFNKSDAIDYDKYTISYRENYESVQGIINNKPALGTEEFITDAIYPTQGGLNVEFVADPSIVGIDASSIRITNNYSTDMEDVLITLWNKNNQCINYIFNDIKAGESKIASTGTNYSEGKYEYASSYGAYGLNSSYSTKKTFASLSGLILGDLSKDFRKYNKRKQIVSYVVEDDSVNTDSDHMLVIAFPKTSIGSKVVDQKNCKISRYEAIVLNPNYDDLADEYNSKKNN